ncbi:hypothetical protein CYMTET_22513 [Cymbomonas tetramitiformis]|uniref:CRAL-TRIO domain-containing protein n=1 Tax=Cymbomonas tetramitiformis TaxID=36881 RepID=A0AAE0FZR7_9CHLO|nr:hypothetical protein CYMTET_22513 [Cymbomonas tetramitiformis]
MLTEGKSRMVKPLVAWYLCSALYLVVKFTANGKLISGGKEGCPDEVLSVSVGVAVGGLIIGAIQIAVLSCARGRRRCDELGMWEEGKLEDGYLALPPSPTDSFRSAASALTFSSSRNSSEFDEYSGSLEHQEQGTSRKTEILRKEREDIFNELANSFDPPNMKEVDGIRSLKLLLSSRTQLLPEHDSHCMLRFLRARDGDVKQASEMFLNTIKWRAEYGVDDLLKEGYNFPEYAAVQEHYPQGYHGVDIEGRPVNIQLVGELNVAKLMQVTTRERLEKQHVYEWEVLLKYKYQACSRQAGRPITQSTTIIDLKGVTLAKFNSARALVQRVSKLDQDYYPEYLHEMIFINTPWIFKTIWAIIRGWVGKRTQDKIKMFGSGYRKELLARIAAENLPTCLGGTCECKGGCLQRQPGPWDDEPGHPLLGH